MTPLKRERKKATIVGAVINTQCIRTVVGWAWDWINLTAKGKQYYGRYHSGRKPVFNFFFLPGQNRL